MQRFWLTVGTVFAVVVSAPASEPAGQWIVVTAPAFREAITPLCEHRKAQGLRVVVVDAHAILSSEEIKKGHAGKLREHIAKLCRSHQGPSYVLLVGAIEEGNDVVPALRGTVGRMKGQPTDNGYGCLDKDLLPAVAVGRFPTRTEEEVRQMVRKTMAYENDRAPGAWRRRLTILAGVPAFNPVVDSLVEGMALARFQNLDPAWQGNALYHNAASRFCVPDGQLRSQALQYVQEGQAFTLYLGHSGPESFYAGRAHYLDRTDWAQLKIERGAGVLLTFGCQGCQLQGRGGEGYGVYAMRNRFGPVAVAGSHGICFAAMVHLAAGGVFESAFARKLPGRLADVWLAIKAGLAHGKIDDITFKLLDAVDGDPRIPQATQRLEHLEMFVLLGDPALRLPEVSRDVELDVSPMVTPGTTFAVKGQVPHRLKDAKVRLTLERPVNSAPADLEPLPAELPGNAEVRNRVMLANHQKANRFVVAAAETVVRDGRFQATLPVAAKTPWPRLILRAYAANEHEEGTGVRVLDVLPTNSKNP